MSLPTSFFRVDETAMREFSQLLVDRLDRHEQMILDLQKKVDDKANLSDLDNLRLEMRKEMEENLAKTNQRIQKLENKVDRMENTLFEVKDKLNEIDSAIDKKIQQAEDKIRSAFDSLIKELEQRMKDKLNDLDNLIPHNEDSMANVLNKLKELENNVTTNSLKIQLTRESVQHIATAYAAINNLNASLDGSLPRVMKQTSDKITKNFVLLFDAITNMSSEIKCLKNSKRPKEEFDISGLELRSGSVPNFQDPPKLPHLEKFGGVEDMVDYMYQLIPKLQGYLYSMHDKISENVNGIGKCAEKEATNTSFRSVNNDIEDLTADMNNIRNALAKVATRADLIGALKKFGSQSESDGSTAVGRVKCIACGRDIQQVTGAMHEEDAERQLGTPSNCLATGGSVGAMYSSIDGLDGGLIESPRSLRPFKGSISAKRKIATPK